MKRTLLRNVMVALAVLSMGVVTVSAASETIELDFSNPDHVALIEQPLPNWPVSIETDPFGNPALFFPNGSADMAPPADVFPHMRFAVIDKVVDDFEFTVNSLGNGAPDADPRKNGGNRSLSLIFGYEDPQNWWVAYYAYTNSTRVAQMIDGEEVRVCWPRVEDVWWPNNDRYQEATLALTTEGEMKVLRAYLDGEPTPLDLCMFPAFMYNPGKVGVGGHSTSTVQSWYINDVKLVDLN